MAAEQFIACEHSASGLQPAGTWLISLMTPVRTYSFQTICEGSIEHQPAYAAAPHLKILAMRTCCQNVRLDLHAKVK